MMTKEERIKKINETEKILKVTEDFRNSAITKKKMHEETLKEKEEALKKLGTTPEEAENKIKELNEEIEKDLETINNGLPIELLKKWGAL